MGLATVGNVSTDAHVSCLVSGLFRTPRMSPVGLEIRLIDLFHCPPQQRNPAAPPTLANARTTGSESKEARALPLSLASCFLSKNESGTSCISTPSGPRPTTWRTGAGGPRALSGIALWDSPCRQSRAWIFVACCCQVSVLSGDVDNAVLLNDIGRGTGYICVVRPRVIKQIVPGSDGSLESSDDIIEATDTASGGSCSSTRPSHGGCDFQKALPSNDAARWRRTGPEDSDIPPSFRDGRGRGAAVDNVAPMSGNDSTSRTAESPTRINPFESSVSLDVARPRSIACHLRLFSRTQQKGKIEFRNQHFCFCVVFQPKSWSIVERSQPW